MGIRRTRPLALACALALLSACSAPQGGVITRFMAPSFRMQAVGTPQEGRTAVAITPAAAQPGVVAPVHDGELTVKFGHLLGARKLMATVADVKSITIQLSGNGVSHTQTISEAQIVNGMTSFTFTGLPAGSLTVTIKALDGTGKVIGQDIQQATITGGQTTVVASTVLIAPTVTSPQVIVTGGSGGSGGGATGSLTTTVTLVDGAPVQNATLVAAYTNATMYQALEVARDNQGNTWFTGVDDTDQRSVFTEGVLKRITPDGTASSIDFAPASPYSLGTQADGSRIFVGGYHNMQTDTSTGPCAFLPDGTRTTVNGLGGSWWSDAFAGAADGTVYTAGADGYLMSVRPNSSIGFATPVGNMDWPSDLETTSSSDAVYALPIYGANPTAGNLLRLRADGTVVYNHALPKGSGLGFDLDAQDNAWYVDSTASALCKVSAAGTQTAVYPLPVRANAIEIDAAGRMWAYQGRHLRWGKTYDVTTPSGAPDDLLMRIGADGKVQAFYHLGLGVDINDIVVTADDHLWVASPTKGLLHYTLPPAPGP